MITIESIEKYKGRTMQLTLSEGEPAFINADIVQRFNLKAGMSIPESAWVQILHDNTYRRARERAMYLLDVRDYSYSEMCKKLMNNYEKSICFEVTDELAEKGFINDIRYAENLARKLCEVRLLGHFRARQYMKEKGLPMFVIEEALEEYKDTAPERAAELVRKKYMKYYDTDDRKQMDKLKNALVRQGYSWSDVKAALEILANEEE